MVNRRTRNFNSGRTCLALTLLELLAVLAILGVLAALLFPILSSALKRGREAESVANLRTLIQGVHTFAAENDGRYPWRGLFNGPTDPGNGVWWWWPDLASGSPYRHGFSQFGEAVGTGLTSSFVFSCPSVPKADLNKFANSTVNYGMNTSLWGSPAVPGGQKLLQVVRPSNFVVFADSYSTAIWPGVPMDRLGDWKTGGKMDAAFLDGHIERIDRSVLAGSSAARNKYLTPAGNP